MNVNRILIIVSLILGIVIAKRGGRGRSSSRSAFGTADRSKSKPYFTKKTHNSDLRRSFKSNFDRWFGSTSNDFPSKCLGSALYVLKKKFSKPGSIEHTSKFRSLIFGATSGYLMFNAGRHIIRDASTPMIYENRKYYWGERRYVPNDTLPIQCVNKIDPQDPQFGKVYFENESRPEEVVYSCPVANNCCGYDCCEESTFFTSIFSLLVLLLVLSVLGMFIIEFVRWCIHCTYFCKHGREREFEPLSI